MELKKTKKADLTHQSGLFFSIGLFTSLLAVILIFESKTTDDVISLNMNRTTDEMEELLDVPPTEQPPPPPPPVQQPQLIEVADEEKIENEIVINIDVEATEETKVENIEIKQEKEEKEESDEIFTIVEEKASPKGGMPEFFKFIATQIKYPEQARRMGIEGRVYCSFTINRDGTIQDIVVIRGIGAGCDQEAVRVIGLSPPWNPSKQRGRPVRSKYNLFIIFQLD
jgi:protein TonB